MAKVIKREIKTWRGSNFERVIYSGPINECYIQLFQAVADELKMITNEVGKFEECKKSQLDHHGVDIIWHGKNSERLITTFKIV